MGKGKGGAGCTVGALELAYAATRRTRAGRPRRVGYIDLDPQGNATDVLEPASRAVGIKDVLAPTDPVPLAQAFVATSWPNVSVAPADRFLANREMDMTAEGLTVLRRARLSGEMDNQFDDIVIDLPRHLGRLSTAGLLGIEHLFITARPTLWGAQGAEEMRYTAQRISYRGNPELMTSGFIVSGYEPGEDSDRIVGEMRKRFGRLLLSPPVPRREKVPEAIESYHTPCREYGDSALVAVANAYQSFYDRTLALHSGEER
ncbi:ParA family protein [Streptomyces crystallinus]|uniref:ParA family protein n=1 Tax=Streptomyces crystallinus TaxID=68191 RepID=UPI0031D1C6D5